MSEHTETLAPPHPAEHSHPGPLEYIKVAIVLAVVTAIEVGLYYVDISHGVLIPSLLILSLIKFVMVMLWFMHLKFDAPIFRRLFVTGFILATSVYAIVLSMFFYRAAG